jgi:hypothetical protein
MQDDLKHLHDTASKLLSSHLSTWAQSLAHAPAGHDDNAFLGELHALLSVRSALSPFIGDHRDASHG